MSEGWTIGPIALKVAVDGQPEDFIVAGWLKEPFGLDFRVFENEDGDFLIGGWVLTHLPTGYVVRQLHCGLEQALRLADEILAAGSWHFTDVEEGKANGRAVKRIMDANPAVVMSGARRSIGPAV